MRKKGLPEPADERELVRVIFQPGFSTSRFITDVSGRGVGLDVVKSRVESLHGSVDLSFTPGAGTRFTLSVPLTLTTLRVLLVGAGGQTFAVAAANAQKLVRADASQVRRWRAGRCWPWAGRPAAGLAGRDARPAIRGGPRRQGPVVVLAAGDKRMAFVVDEFQAEQEVVVKSLAAASAACASSRRRRSFRLERSPCPEYAEPDSQGVQRPAGPALASPERAERPAKNASWWSMIR